MPAAITTDPTILVTGFGAFGGIVDNPSLAVMAALSDRARGIVGAELPVSHEGAVAALQALIATHRPAVWLGFGVAPAATAIRLETTGRNAITAAKPDNDGRQPAGDPVVPGAAATLPSRLPLARIEPALVRAGHAVVLSDDAGGYVCNTALTAGLHLMPADRIAGFVHLPPLPGSVPDTPGWPLERTLAAARLVLAAIVDEFHSNFPDFPG
ncbi:MAG: pyroglutamyl-peptidase I [Azospirillaceae bacterium]